MNKIQALIIILIQLIITDFSYSQGLFQKKIGGANNESYPKILGTNDNGHLIYSRTLTNSYGDLDMALMKLDVLGNIEWNKHIGTNSRDLTIQMIHFGDNYLGAGWLNYSGAVDDVSLMIFDANGNILDRQAWGGSLDEEIQSVVYLNDGNIAITGDGNFIILQGNFELFYSIVDPSLAMGQVFVYSTPMHDTPRKIIQGTNNDIFIAGYLMDGTARQGFLMRIDLQGNLLWAYQNPTNLITEYWNVLQTGGGDLFCIGSLVNNSNGGTLALISKYNASGNLLWAKTISLENNVNNKAIQILESHTGNFAVLGTTSATLSSNDDIFLLEIDSNGNFISGYTYGGSMDETWPNMDYSTLNSGYTIISETKSYGASGTDFLIINTDDSAKSCCSNPIGSVQIQNQALNIVPANFTTGTTSFPEQSYTINSNAVEFGNETICKAPVLIVGPDTLFCNEASYAKYTIDLNELVNLTWVVPPTATIINNINDTTIYVDFNGQSGTIYLLSGNCMDTLDSKFVTIAGIENFNLGNDTIYCFVQSILLNAGSTFASYLWQDGSTGSTFTVNASGTYWVSVTDLYGCSDSDTINLTLFTDEINLGNDTLICSNEFITLDAGGGFNNYLWSNGAITQSIIVNSASNYFVEGGFEQCRSYDTLLLSVQPEAFAYAGSNQSICESENFDFATCNVPPAANSYDSIRWIGGLGSFSDPTMIHPVYYPDITESGNVNLSLVAYTSFPCENDTSSMILTIEPLPVADFNLLPSDQSCPDSPIDFMGNSTTNIIDWNWDFGDGSLAFDGQNAVHTYSIPGNYVVTLVVTNTNNCSDTVTHVVVVNELPLVNFFNTPDSSLCIDEIIFFTDNSSPNVISWNWNFDDGNFSLLQNPSHSFSSDGLYNVELTVTDANTCTNTYSSPIQVFPSPAAQIVLTPGNTICSKLPLNFHGLDNNGTNITDWNWDFGDGSPVALGQDVSHAYQIAGIYTVSLTLLNDNSCSDIVSTDVVINELPQADFTISSDTSCVGENIILAATGTSDIVSWNWQFGDGNTAIGQNVSHTYSNPASQTYNIFSIYQNANGCLDTTIHQHRVENVSIGIHPDPNPGCQNFSVDLNGIDINNNASFADWIWDFGDLTTGFVGQNTSHTYSQSGTYDVSLDVCNQHVIQQVAINPTCQVDAGGLQRTCQDVYFNYSRSLTPPTASGYSSIMWFTTGAGHFDDPTLVAPTYFPDPSEGVTQNDTLIMTMVGYGLAPCGNDTSTAQLIVIPGAYAQAGSDENSCFGDPYDFANSTDSAFATHYATLLWSTSGTGHFVDPNAMQPIYVPGPGEIGPVTLTMVAANIINCDSIDEMVLTIRPTYEIPVDITVCYYDSVFAQGSWQYTTGTYFDTLNTVNYGCDSVIVTNLTVRPKVDQGFTMSATGSICRKETISFTSTGTANIVSRLWDFGDGFYSNAANPVHQYNTAGSFTIVYSYTDENGCSDSLTSQIQVNELPDVSFTMSVLSSCMDTPIDFSGNSTSNIVSWDWDFGDGQTASGQNVTHSYSTWGDMTITLTVTDQNGCTETSIHNITIVEPVIVDFSYTIDSCLTVHFIDESTPPPGYYLVTWDWDLGDGNTHDDPEFSHQYAAGGLYNVTLTVTAEESTGHSCTNSITLPVIVPHTPTIYYTWDPEPTCLGDTTHFYGTSGTEITEWYWDFDDGLFGNGQGIDHLYTAPGTYNVTLYITDTNLCTNSLVHQVNINPMPEVTMTIDSTPTCAGTTTLFTGSSTANITNWYWEFGDGGISTSQNPQHIYTTGGTYYVTLTATDDAGCSGSTTGMVQVTPNPIADYTYTITGCNTFEFTDTSTPPANYNITAWLWDFGDGFTANVPNPVHVFPAGGFYDVTLTVTGSNSNFSCTDEITYTIQAPNGPTAFFTWFPNPAQTGEDVNFFGTSGSTITSWEWDFDDGFMATVQNPTHPYINPGNYQVTLTVTDENGCIVVVTNEVTIGGLPDVEFTWSAACEGTPVQFTVDAAITDTAAVQGYYWQFGDGLTSTQQNPLHAYTTAGLYTATLTITDTIGYSNSVSHEIDVKPNPVSVFGIDSPNCQGANTQLTDYSTSTSGFITTWEWDFGDGNTQTVNFPDDPDVSHTYANTGTYDITLTVTSSDGCQGTSQEQVTITPAPIALFSSSSTCSSGPVSFQDESTANGSGTIISWQWNFGDPASGTNNTSTNQHPTHVFTAPGSYDVTLIIESSSGCSDTTTQSITVSDPPEVEFTYSPACMGEDIQFTVDGTITDIANVSTWSWSFGDGQTSNLQDPTHNYTSPGDYDVTLSIETNDGCTASITHTVTVNPLPNAQFDYSAPTCQGDSIHFMNLSSSPNGPIVKWEWDFGDGTSQTILAPNNPNTSHLYLTDNTYDVTLTVTDSDSCQNTSQRQVQVVPSPVAEFTWEDACYGTPVLFTDLTSENSGPDLYGWLWVFGDPLSGTNNSSTLQNPSHEFTAPGDYTVTLIVTNTQGCDDTITHDLTVNDPPDVSFTMSSDTLCMNEPVQFTGASTTPISSWFWDFGDGGIAITQSPQYVYTTPGTYTVSLTVTGLDGCTATASEQITVKDQPIANFSYENACLGDSTYFRDESFSQLGYINEWQWDFGDGSTSTDQHPSHYYMTSDDYQVTLIAMDNYGCSDTISQWIQVRTIPMAMIESYVQVCEPTGQVYFFDGSTPGADGSPIQSWEWNLDDGYYSSEIDPEYIYAKTDTCYQITLMVTDANGCYSTDTMEVCLFGTLEVDFTAQKQCLGQPTTFYASYTPPSDSVASYQWDFNDGSPIQTTYHDTIVHTFANPGMYVVNLSALDTNGCTATMYHEVYIDSLPTPRFSYQAGSCELPTQFTDESLGGGEFIQSWLWDFGDALNLTQPNTSTLQDPTHLYGPTDSTYSVKLIVTNFNGCTDSIVQQVTTRACLVANFYVPDTIPLCARSAFCFADSSSFSTSNGNITRWDWDFGDGTTDSYTIFQPQMCHSYALGGTYAVTLTLTGEIGTTTYSNSITKTVTVNATPTAGITVENNCLNDSTYFFDNTTIYGVPTVTWHWDFGDLSATVDTAFIPDPAYLYVAYDTYTTELIVINEAGCTDTTTREVTIYKPPVADFSWEETCQGYYTNFFDESTADSASISVYNWHFGDPFTTDSVSSLQDPAHIYNLLGVYSVNLLIVDANSCQDDTTKLLEIWPVPTALFTLTEDWEGKQGQVKLDNQSEGATNYFWDFDDGFTSSEQHPIHQYLTDSDPVYILRLVAYNEFGCPDTLDYPYTLIFTGLYVPNAFSPSVSDAAFRTFKPVGINLSEYKLEVFSSWGNLVFTTALLENGQPAEGWDGTFEGQDMPTGTYIWRITARFSDQSYWRGSDNGDGNTKTQGTVTLIR